MRIQPRSFADITALLTSLLPEGDPGAMQYAVRTHLPMVQVPVKTTWSYPGKPRFTLAEDWLAARLREPADRSGGLAPRAGSGVVHRVDLPGLRVAATVLVGGFVAGTWTTERAKQAAAGVVVPI